MGWLNVAGLVLQVGGTMLAVFGLGQTWRAYAPERGFTAAILAPVLTAGPVLHLRRLLGWHPSVVALAGVAEATGTAVSSTLLVDRPWPADVPGQVAELRRQALALNEAMTNAAVLHASDVADLRRRLAALGSEQTATAAALAIKVREGAIGGVLVAARGLALVALGLALQVPAAPRP